MNLATSNANSIGLNQEQAQQLCNKLNDLLANYQVFYANVHGFHWNLKGEKFFELHAKFEELYTDLFNKIDEIAERIVILGGVPWHSYSNYLKAAKITETGTIHHYREATSNVLESLKLLIVKQRETLKLAQQAEDGGTENLVGEYIQQQEKLIWMYEAYLSNEQ